MLSCHNTILSPPYVSINYSFHFCQNKKQIPTNQLPTLSGCKMFPQLIRALSVGWKFRTQSNLSQGSIFTMQQLSCFWDKKISLPYQADSGFQFWTICYSWRYHNNNNLVPCFSFKKTTISRHNPCLLWTARLLSGDWVSAPSGTNFYWKWESRVFAGIKNKTLITDYSTTHTRSGA